MPRYALAPATFICNTSCWVSVRHLHDLRCRLIERSSLIDWTGQIELNVTVGQSSYAASPLGEKTRKILPQQIGDDALLVYLENRGATIANWSCWAGIASCTVRLNPEISVIPYRQSHLRTVTVAAHKFG